MADSTTAHVSTACAVLHTDSEGNAIPCPGYPHAAAAGPEEDPLTKARRLVAEEAEARAQACAAEIQAVLAKYGMRLEISTPAVTIVPL